MPRHSAWLVKAWRDKFRRVSTEPVIRVGERVVLRERLRQDAARVASALVEAGVVRGAGRAI